MKALEKELDAKGKEAEGKETDEKKGEEERQNEGNAEKEGEGSVPFGQECPFGRQPRFDPEKQSDLHWQYYDDDKNVWLAVDAELDREIKEVEWQAIYDDEQEGPEGLFYTQQFEDHLDHYWIDFKNHQQTNCSRKP